MSLVKSLMAVSIRSQVAVHLAFGLRMVGQEDGALFLEMKSSPHKRKRVALGSVLPRLRMRDRAGCATAEACRGLQLLSRYWASDAGPRPLLRDERSHDGIDSSKRSRAGDSPSFDGSQILLTTSSRRAFLFARVSRHGS